MPIFSLTFLAFAAATVLMVFAVRRRAYRHGVLMVANVVFVATFLDNWWSATAMLAWVAGGYVALLPLPRMSGRTLLVILIGLAVTILLVVRKYAFLRWVPGLLAHPVQLIGISYMTFKYIHVAVDRYQGQLDELDVVTYANYQLGFWCLVAGPIQRYNDFARSWRAIETAPASETDALRGWRRALLGMLKIGVVGSLAWHADLTARVALLEPTDPAATVGWFLLMFYAFPTYVYFNFAGYCDVVIGLATVLGIRHQENFNRPYLARNVLDFWNRWHISLTLWIRDYLFTPMYKAVATHWPGIATVLGYGALFLALLLAGIWHGASWNFVAFGLVHGVGVAVVQMYGDLLKSRIGRKGVRQYLARPGVRMLAIGVTINYVCMSFLFFRPGLRDTLVMLRDVAGRIFTGA